ncbi:hypothetical protein GOODEAATRI_012245 [Goodea atripinnis]|uniref:Uncharacterized protein n=1 Tax=Goodea atripinnis TaxID=208336 RepID=A0ABV0MH54_9TELE
MTPRLKSDYPKVGDISNPHLPPNSSSSQTIWRLLQDIPYNEFSGQSRCCYRTASSGLHCNPPAVTWTRPAHRDGSVPTTRASISLCGLIKLLSQFGGEFSVLECAQSFHHHLIPILADHYCWFGDIAYLSCGKANPCQESI